MNKTIIIIFIIFILLCFLLYKLTFKNRTESKIRQFEKTYSKNLDRRQKDYCSSTKNLNKRRLADYYVCSSHNSQLTGFLNYDYSSNTYLGKIINYGCRYIELDIFSKDSRNESEPVVSSGNKSYDGQNFILCKDVFRLIAKTVFSKNKVDNFKDPFFIYLNCKTNNVNVMNKLNDIIKETIGNRLILEPFGTNIGNMKMCDLMNKIILFGSNNIEKTNLVESVSLTPNSNSYLQRIEYNQLPFKENLNTSDDTLPKVGISSNDVKIDGSLIQFGDFTNPLSLGIEKGMKLSFKEHYKITIENVSNNSIRVDSTYDLGKHDSNKDTLHFSIFEPIFNNADIINFNKNGLTIVHFENNFFPDNKDAVEAWKLGCQFVAINFQRIDFDGMKYINTFYDDSFILKPSNLRNTIQEEEIEEHVREIEYPNIDFNKVIQNPIQKYPQFSFKTIKKPIMYGTVSNYNLKLTPIKSNKAVFIMQNSKQPKSIKITFTSAVDNMCLHVPENCCYLNFAEKPEDPIKADKWEQNTTFYPVKSKHIKGNISFMFIKNNDAFYITQLNPKELKTKMNLYASIKFVKQKNELYIPKEYDEYKPVGYNFDTQTDRTIFYFDGAVENPKDLKFVHRKNKFNIYKPIPPEGFKSMGFIFTKKRLENDKKEKKKIIKTIVCIREDKLKPLSKDTLEQNGTEAQLGLIEYNGFFYNMRDYEHYELNNEEKYVDRLYLSKSGDNSFFAVKENFDSKVNQPDLDISPEIFNTPSNSNQSLKITTGGKCLSIKNGFWADENNLQLEMINCLDNYTPSDFFLSNEKIYSKQYPSKCLSIKNNIPILEKCNAYEDNQLFEYKKGILSMKFQNKNLSYKDNILSFEEDADTIWNINSYTPLKNKNKAFVLARVPRMKSVYYGNMVKPNLDEFFSLFNKDFIDDKYFHIWIKCSIEIKDKNYYAKPIGMPGKQKQVNKTQIVLPNNTEVNIGDKVLISDGTYLNFNENYVKWEATIVKKMKNNKVKVVMGPNSIEPNLNKFNAGRPRIITEKVVDVSQCIPKILAMKVPNP